LQFKLLKYSFGKHTATNQLIQDVIDFTELGNFIYAPVKTYSSGMMLRLAVSLFKVVNPRILLLDEVFSSGDIIFQKKANVLLKKQLDSAECIIMASHNLSEIKSYCTKCLIIEKGKLVFIGNIDDSLNNYFDRNKSKPIYSNIILKETTVLNPDNNNILHSEKIVIRLVYEKNNIDFADAILYLKSPTQNVLTDCVIYRENFERLSEPDGVYQIEFEIPGYLINAGMYMVDISFGDGLNEIEYYENCASFKVIPDAWEKEKLWNLNPTFPIRPRLKWKKELLKLN
jgi:ABC-type multidrug transport system ATPase subunit